MSFNWVLEKVAIGGVEMEDRFYFITIISIMEKNQILSVSSTYELGVMHTRLFI